MPKYFYLHGTEKHVMNELKSQFLLDPSVTYLNHGSFGACPKPIFSDYQQWQLELEQEPAQFITVNGPQYLAQSRKALGAYVGCDGDDLVFTPNPSYAFNIIAKSFDLKPGDEILTTDIEYGAMDRTWNYYCRKAGAKYVRQPISFPIVSKEQIIDDFWKGFSPKTKAIFISQITSSTALILPVKEICEMAKAKGLITIVDGAHVPGHIPLNLSELKADIYTGACHKWMLTPKGCSFLYVKKEFQDRFDPLVVSWGYEAAFPSHSKFLDYHEMQGTRDFSAFLTVPKAIAFLEMNNWTQVAADCRQLVLKNYERVCEVLGTQPICPVSEDFLGQMCSTPIRTDNPQALQRKLFETFRIEVPVMVHADRTFIRFSTQAYVMQEDIDKLIDALKTIYQK